MTERNRWERGHRRDYVVTATPGTSSLAERITWLERAAGVSDSRLVLLPVVSADVAAAGGEEGYAVELAGAIRAVRALGRTPIPVTDPAAELTSSALNDLVRAVAAENNAFVIDLAGEMLAQNSGTVPSTWFDGDALSAFGHGRAAARVLKDLGIYDQGSNSANSMVRPATSPSLTAPATLAAAGTVGTVDGPSGRVSVPGLAVGNSATAPVTIAVPADAEPGDVIRVAVNASAANQRQAIAPRVVEVAVAADAEPTATPKSTPTVTVTVTAPTPTVTTTTTVTPTVTLTPTTTVTPTATLTPTVTTTATSTATVHPTVTVTVAPTTKAPTTSPPTDAPVDLYLAPGFHRVNGRQWYTECEAYSRTIRCTTQIHGTQVNLVDGHYVSTTGWIFNNLTYAPLMTRSQWASNPLGYTGSWSAADGRRWRTECDTAITGSDASRSYTWSSHISSVQQADGTWRHFPDEGWVMNNMVRFRA
nr:SGNH/GDSL hydrolase family protein [Tessaracoccus rhinocerotis]